MSQLKPRSLQPDGKMNRLASMITRPNDTITIVVGEGEMEQRFVVHTALATSNSAYFDTAMKGDWKETREGVFTYKDDHPLFWTLCIYWMYSGLIDLTATEHMSGDTPKQSSIRSVVDFAGDALATTEQKSPAPDDIKNKLGWGKTVNLYTKLIFAYILGDKLQADSFKNALIDAMCRSDVKQDQLSCSTIRYAFEEISHKSVLRSFLVDHTLCTSEADLVKANLSVAQHQDFVLLAAEATWGFCQGYQPS